MQPFFVDLGDPLADNRIQNDLSRTESAAALAIDREPEEKGLLMKHFYPDYVKPFRCIAADCPDSCCQGWDVVIDEETEAYYRSVQGAFGEKLKNAVFTDGDGDRIFRLAEHQKCPFWGEDRLCEIYKELGREALCRTCALFPRITMDYTVFCEHTLALACPEAARLIVGSVDAYASFEDIAVEACDDYDTELMQFLLDARQKAAKILTAEQPLAQRLDVLKQFARDKQTELTGREGHTEYYSLKELYSALEYIDEENRERIVRAAEADADCSRHETELTALALYWLYRYLLGAIDTRDLFSPIRFLTDSVRIAANMAKESGDIITAAQTYSKEIEQSYENMEMLFENQE